jgi:hypothetical protein
MVRDVAAFCACITRFQIRLEERAMLRLFGTSYRSTWPGCGAGSEVLPQGDGDEAMSLQGDDSCFVHAGSGMILLHFRCGSVLHRLSRKEPSINTPDNQFDIPLKIPTGGNCRTGERRASTYKSGYHES